MSRHPDPNVLVDRDSRGVARITIDYPTRLNVLNTPMLEMLTGAIRDVSAADELRAVVLTGAGDRAFVGGADIKEFARLDAPGARAFITRVHGVCQAARDCPVPVIARVNGYCLGAGMELAAACDMRAASENAIFGMPEVRVGVPSVVEAALLPRLIGWGNTNELLLTGDTVDARHAQRIGFVERVSPAVELDDAVERWLESIVASAPLAVRAQKALIRKWEALSLDASIAAGIDAFSASFETDEPKRYTEPFLNRKK